MKVVDAKGDIAKQRTKQLVHVWSTGLDDLVRVISSSEGSNDEQVNEVARSDFKIQMQPTIDWSDINSLAESITSKIQKKGSIPASSCSSSSSLVHDDDGNDGGAEDLPQSANFDDLYDSWQHGIYLSLMKRDEPKDAAIESSQSGDKKVAAPEAPSMKNQQKLYQLQHSKSRRQRHYHQQRKKSANSRSADVGLSAMVLEALQENCQDPKESSDSDDLDSDIEPTELETVDGRKCYLV